MYPPVAVAALGCLLLACWLGRIERYPFTAMQMFSAFDPSGVVEYYKVLAHDESGIATRISLTDVLGSEADFRYRYRLREAFDPATAHAATRYLTVGGDMLNQRAPEGSKVTRLEVERWQWNFRTQPESPTYGALVDRFTVMLAASGGSGTERRPAQPDGATTTQ
jgi:hypothetical protein